MSPGPPLTLAEGRYDRQERIPWWDQDRLAAARVVVLGAGALGNEVVKNLVLVGVGRVLVVDHDVVEASNLARGVFFRPEDEGRPKALAVAERAGVLSADTEVVGAVRDLRSFGTGLARRADVLVAGLDSRAARLAVNRLAWRAGRPWVDGAIEALWGVARVFHPPTSCYECTLTEADHALLARRQSCRLLTTADLVGGRVPTTATTASVVGGLQAQEVVKLVHGHRRDVSPLHGGVMVDGANNDAYVVRYPLRAACPAHDPLDDPVVLAAGPTTTVADLVSAVGWEDATVDLGDDHLAGWHCPACRRDRPDRGPIVLRTATDAACPDCSGPRRPHLVTSVVVRPGRPSPSLVDLGLRPDEVLSVRRGTERRTVWAAGPDPALPPGW